MKIKYVSKLLSTASLAAILTATGCGKKNSNSSDVLVTDVEHSEVKRQSIGNCWLYATASWVESMHLSATHEELNVSETYWTYWHFYNQMVHSGITKIQTGGWWYTATNIIREHGWVLEGDFVAAEATSEMSASQSRAEMTVNQALGQGGELESPRSRTPANVRKVLNKAFGADIENAERVARKASDLIIGEKDGHKITLADASNGSEFSWGEVSYEREYGKDTIVSDETKMARKETLKRVLRALNDRKPVIMSFMVDFNALDSADATFKLSKLQSAGRPGRQGGHMLVLEDYTVENVPGVGSIGEGDVSNELKEKALLGDVRTLVAKNSWGKNRPDRGLTDGYTRFEMSYLDAQLEWTQEGSTSGSWYTTLTDFVLPPGY